jgi:hypothetical protein
MADKIPASLDEAIDILMAVNAEHIDKLRGPEGREIVTRAHLSTGMQMRNNWKLWYNKPGNALTDWFTTHDINHGDDRSGAIMKALLCRINGEEFDLDAYKERLRRHWLKYGPAEWNGIVPPPGTGE